ncbi:MAG: hypothetical protein AB1457_12035 [Chloroflexota bacterium]
MPLLTIFTAPKPFTNPHIAMIQRNALRSWLALGDEVEVLLIGEEEGIAETAAELGVRHLPQVERNAYGTPLIRSIFDLARRHGSGRLLAYVNADILLLPDFITAAQRAAERFPRFLMVGQRWDVDVRQPLDFEDGWAARLRQMALQEGRLHPPGGSDYFIFPRQCFENVPPMAVGRAGWDNWMIYAARAAGFPVIDASQGVMILHQSHDYSHLPGGQPHYRLPETEENVRLGGGKLTIFKLADATHCLTSEGVFRLPLKGEKLRREVEIFPLVRLHSPGLAWLFFAIFHPYQAYAEARKRLAANRNRKEG